MVTLNEQHKMAEDGMKAIMNSMGYGIDYAGPVIVEEFARSHASLQQGFVQSVIAPIMKFLAETRYIDARNERSQEYARLVVASTKEHPFNWLLTMAEERKKRLGNSN